MTAKEACGILLDEMDGYKPISCMEYETLFVFQIVPESYKPKKEGETLLDGLFSVNKATHRVKSFKPFDLPIAEYRAGKRITDFKVI